MPQALNRKRSEFTAPLPGWWPFPLPWGPTLIASEIEQIVEALEPFILSEEFQEAMDDIFMTSPPPSISGPEDVRDLIEDWCANNAHVAFADETDPGGGGDPPA